MMLNKKPLHFRLIALHFFLYFAYLFVPFAYANEDYLAPEVAFQFSARMRDAKNVEVNFNIADGYYMYRDRFRFQIEGGKLSEPKLPEGKVKFDDTFQKNVETYRKRLSFILPVEAIGTFRLLVTSQGCADKGLCYSPLESSVTLSSSGESLLSAVGASPSVSNTTGNPFGLSKFPASSSLISIPKDIQIEMDAESGALEASLKSGKLFTILPLFFLLGLGLSFTPCVLPMVPILSFIIVGEGAGVKRRRGFVLSLAYSLGMAIIYTALGIFAGLIGEGLSASLQNPWVLSAFALLMVALSLSMFGLYQLQIPTAIQNKLLFASEQQRAGKLFGVFVMGAISALIVGPCVAAPLAAALVYISQTRDIVIGGSALFSMAIGMSVPLILVGISAGALLPRAGAWMNVLKRFFGVMMLAMAIWMLSPVLPSVLQMFAWFVLATGYGIHLLRDHQSGGVAKVAAALFVVLGVLQLLGAATGGRDPFSPLAHLSNHNEKKIAFIRVKTLDELDAKLADGTGKIAMLDFYADWCISCKEMEKLTFNDPRIQEQISQMLLLQVDVTANTADDKAILKRFNLFGPPGIIFFDKEGKELQGRRVIGYQNAERFAKSLSFVMQN